MLTIARTLARSFAHLLIDIIGDLALCLFLSIYILFILLLQACLLLQLLGWVFLPVFIASGVRCKRKYSQ